jgi:hypothetical protein
MNAIDLVDGYINNASLWLEGLATHNSEVDFKTAMECSERYLKMAKFLADVYDITDPRLEDNIARWSDLATCEDWAHVVSYGFTRDIAGANG